jgi:hypothetical protein
VAASRLLVEGSFFDPQTRPEAFANRKAEYRRGGLQRQQENKKVAGMSPVPEKRFQLVFPFLRHR